MANHLNDATLTSGTTSDNEAQVNFLIRKCDMPCMDLLFLVDNSGSITLRCFEKAKRFMKFIVRRSIDVGVHKSRVGLVIFSQEPCLVFGMDKYLNSEFLANFADAIGRIHYHGGGSYVGKALDFACELFRGLKVHRNNHQNDLSEIEPIQAEDQEITKKDERIQTLILISDGCSGDRMELAAERLHQLGVRVVAVGSKNHQKESLAVVTRDEKCIFMLDQTFDLIRYLENLKIN